MLEKEVIEREIEKESLNPPQEKDTRIQELNFGPRRRRSKSNTSNPNSELQRRSSRRADRLGKVYGIAEELDTTCGSL